MREQQKIIEISLTP